MSFLRRTVNMLLPEGLKEGPEFRKRVEWLMLLRLLLTTLLLGATIFFQLRESRAFFVDPAIPLYILVGATFLLSLVYAFILPMMTDLRVFSFVQVVVDVLYTSIVVYFTGGASSVFTLLYAFPIAASGILHHRRGAIAVAFIASGMFCLLLNLEFYDVLPTAYWPWVSPWSHRTPDYILWVLVVHITFFSSLPLWPVPLPNNSRASKYLYGERKATTRDWPICTWGSYGRFPAALSPRTKTTR